MCSVETIQVQGSVEEALEQMEDVLPESRREVFIERRTKAIWTRARIHVH